MTDKADNDALLQVTPEMLDAWVNYDPPYTELPRRPAAIHGAIQSAFYGGYVAALRTPQPDETETLRAEVERLREALGVADDAIKEMFRYYDGVRNSRLI